MLYSIELRSHFPFGAAKIGGSAFLAKHFFLVKAKKGLARKVFRAEPRSRREAGAFNVAAAPSFQMGGGGRRL